MTNSPLMDRMQALLSATAASKETSAMAERTPEVVQKSEANKTRIRSEFLSIDLDRCRQILADAHLEDYRSLVLSPITNVGSATSTNNVLSLKVLMGFPLSLQDIATLVDDVCEKLKSFKVDPSPTLVNFRYLSFNDGKRPTNTVTKGEYEHIDI